jgi:hypothetical protein
MIDVEPYHRQRKFSNKSQAQIYNLSNIYFIPGSCNVIEWTSDCCWMPSEQVDIYIMAKTSFGDDIRFVLDQHA